MIRIFRRRRPLAPKRIVTLSIHITGDTSAAEIARVLGPLRERGIGPG